MENGNRNKTFMYLLLTFFAIFIATGLFVGLGNKKNPEPAINGQAATSQEPATLKQENMVIPTIKPTEGALAITADSPTATLSTPVSIKLSGNSNSKNIVGYDTVIFYDPLAFEFVEAKSELADFKIYSYNRGNYLMLTAVKSLDSKAPTVLGSGTGNEPMATISFKPKKTGKFNFSLKLSAEKDVTDLVTDQTEVLSPALSDMTVEIK